MLDQGENTLQKIMILIVEQTIGVDFDTDCTAINNEIDKSRFCCNHLCLKWCVKAVPSEVKSKRTDFVKIITAFNYS